VGSVEHPMVLEPAREDVKVIPEELTEGLQRLGLIEGDSVMVYASLDGWGCSNGFGKIKPYLSPKKIRETTIGLASIELHAMNLLVEYAESLFDKDPMALACDNTTCLNCALVAR
jgi:aminoglycoside N3'-acetyltransferase